jgi:hypothetical protein
MGRRGTVAARTLAVLVVLSGLAALAASRFGSVATRDAGAAGRARRFEWAPGHLDVYAVHWDGTSGRDALVGDGKDLTGTATFDGDLSVRTLQRDASGVGTVAYVLERIRAYGLNVDGQELVSESDRRLAIAALLGQEAIVRVDGRGIVDSIAYHHDTPPSTRELLRRLVGMMRVTLSEQPGATSWSAHEPTPNGLARVRYEDDGDALRRVRLSYDGITGMENEGELEQQLSSTAAIVLDPHGSLQSLADQESLKAHGATGAFASRWTFSAKRASSGTFDAKAAKLDDLDEATGASQLARERQRGRDQRLSEGWDLGSIEVQLSVYGNGARIDSTFVARAAAYVRLHPESCAHLVAWFQDPRLTDLGRQLLLDVLSAAGSEEAQAAMRDALGTPEARDPALRGALVQRFVFVADPTPESARFVASVYADARAAGETRVAFRAAASLGAIVEHLSGSDALAAEIDARLRADLAERRSPEEEVALMLALGNARQEEDLPAIEAFAGDDQVTVREQVARSLRRFDDPTAAAALLALARDPQPVVTRASFRALRDQSLDDGDWESLARAVEQGQTTARAYEALVDLLERRPDCGPVRAGRMLHVVLDRVPDTSGNHELRERVARLLAEPPQ